jgi:hypothetical protein
MENEQRKTELESEAKLKIVQAEAKRQFEIAEVLSAGLVQVESAKMRKQVEELRAQELLAKQRANELMTVQVAAEKTVEESKGAGQAKIVDAKAAADAILLRAEAEAKQIRWKAEAQSFAKQEEGRGLKSYLEQKAEGVAMLKQAIGSAENLQRLLMIEQEVPTKIAQFTAKAVEGLKPRITITNSNWNRGTEGTDAVGSDALGNIITNTMMQTAQVAKEAARITGIKILPEMLVPEDDKKT